MSEYALQLNNITKKYNDGESENIVLKDISLNVKHGEFVAIVGPSGSGKSTLLSIAGMLLSPNSGEIVLNGKCLSDEKQKNWTKIRRKQIGFIFQNHQLLPYLTVEEQLKLVKNMNKKVSLDVNETLKELGLKDCAKKYPSNMSGGEKQRIAIARAFMNNPDVILADEPTASLDGTRGRQVVEMIKKEVMKHNKAAVMVTHDERILDLVDVIYRMDKGVLVRDN
jgi:putative ABC transport system ATP-binding protein